MLLFVLAGQSNMAGRGKLMDSDGDDGNPQILCFQQQRAGSDQQEATSTSEAAAVSEPSEEAWRVARHPLHADKPQKAGVGPALSFAAEVLRKHQQQRPDKGKGTGNDGAAFDLVIGLVPCAFGGSELARWSVGGDLRHQCIRRVQRAVVAAANATGVVDDDDDHGGGSSLNHGSDRVVDEICLAGILWHQGESDCALERSATYPERLPVVLEQLRGDLVFAFAEALAATKGILRKAPVAAGNDNSDGDVSDDDDDDDDGDASNETKDRQHFDCHSGVTLPPLVVGELPYYLDQSQERFVGAGTANAAIVALATGAGALEKTGCASAHGLNHNGDRLHFDSDSLVELGRRYAAVWMELDSSNPKKDESIATSIIRDKKVTEDQDDKQHCHPFSFPSVQESASAVAATRVAIID